MHAGRASEFRSCRPFCVARFERRAGMMARRVRRNPLRRSRDRPAATPGQLRTLPIPLTSFVGRERELAEAERLLATTRLLTLTGTGGCGKSRLALELASRAARAAAGAGAPENSPQGYPQGVWWVELAALADGALVPRALAAALGLRDQGREPTADRLLAFLRPRRVLLVLDNCEHLLDDCARLADALLHGCPGVRVLATSREPLGVGGELAWRVPSLACPPPGDPPPL